MYNTGSKLGPDYDLGYLWGDGRCGASGNVWSSGARSTRGGLEDKTLRRGF